MRHLKKILKRVKCGTFNYHFLGCRGSKQKHLLWRPREDSQTPSATLSHTVRPLKRKQWGPPALLMGGRGLPTSWNLNVCSRLLLGALLFGVSFDPESRLLFGLLDHSSFTFSCPFSCKVKKYNEEFAALSSTAPPPDHNVQRETSRSKQTRDLQRRQSRSRGNRESKLFVAALLLSHCMSVLSSFLFQTSPQRLPQLLSVHHLQRHRWLCKSSRQDGFLCDQTGNGPLFKGNKERLHRSGSLRLPCVYVNNFKTCDVRASVLPPCPT